MVRFPPIEVQQTIRRRHRNRPRDSASEFRAAGFRCFRIVFANAAAIGVRPDGGGAGLTHFSEYSLAELLDDPLVELVMKSDGVDRRTIELLFERPGFRATPAGQTAVRSSSPE